jgi:hypothetical protein
MNPRHLLVPLLVLGALAGCTIVPPATEAPHSAAKPTAAAAAADPALLAAGTVVARAAFTAPDGLTTGDIVITADGHHQFDYVVSNLVTPVTGQIDVEFSPRPFTDQAYCDADGFAIYSTSQLQLAPAATVNPAHEGDLDFRSPDFFDTVLLVSTDGSIPKTGCFYPVVASADLSWTLPDQRPDLVVVDSGQTGGAMGLVAESDGVSASYEVVAGDVLDEIAARFGITVSDLFYLNPERNKGIQREAFAGELFNLLKSER